LGVNPAKLVADESGFSFGAKPAAAFSFIGSVTLSIGGIPAVTALAFGRLPTQDFCLAGCILAETLVPTLRLVAVRAPLAQADSPAEQTIPVTGGGAREILIYNYKNSPREPLTPNGKPEESRPWLLGQLFDSTQNYGCLLKK
jgi:hypothetical protein